MNKAVASVEAYMELAHAVASGSCSVAMKVRDLCYDRDGAINPPVLSLLFFSPVPVRKELNALPKKPDFQKKKCGWLGNAWKLTVFTYVLVIKTKAFHGS